MFHSISILIGYQSIMDVYWPFLRIKGLKGVRFRAYILRLSCYFQHLGIILNKGFPHGDLFCSRTGNRTCFLLSRLS